MADVTGPISTLPGSGHDLPDGMECDYHPGVPATVRIQGETDSFGCEMEDMCDACWQRRLKYHREHAAEWRCGRCDWCKTDATDLRDARDYEEGMCGPVYRICGACQKRRDDQIQQDLDYYSGCYGD